MYDNMLRKADFTLDETLSPPLSLTNKFSINIVKNIHAVIGKIAMEENFEARDNPREIPDKIVCFAFGCLQNLIK
jgi:hypothetical protein